MKKVSSQGMAKVLTAGVVTLVTAASLGLAGCGSSNNAGSGSAQTTAASTEAKQEEPYTITGEELSKDEYSAKIVGTLTNNSDKEYGYIQISYNLYDADGAQIGTAFANTSNLKAKGTWKFEALCSVEPDKIAKFERTEVQGF